jgi:hypothetical protein
MPDEKVRLKGGFGSSRDMKGMIPSRTLVNYDTCY